MDFGIHNLPRNYSTNIYINGLTNFYAIVLFSDSADLLKNIASKKETPTPTKLIGTDLSLNLVAFFGPFLCLK